MASGCREQHGVSFTRGIPWIATEGDVKAKWGGDPKRFHCGICGHRFVVGDTVRWQYSPRQTNFLVCEKCDDEPETLIARREEMFRIAEILDLI